MKFKTWLESEGLDRVWLDHPQYGKETIGEFLQRHQIPVNSDGTFILYHGRPKDGEYTELRAGTYLATDPESAKFYAARDRGLDKEKDIEVIELTLTPDEINPGIHITLRVPKQI